jgi:TRAP-type C4-dicarboxylate transport system permease small subunit
MVMRGVVGVARGIHIVSALWVLLIAFVIITDVLGRALFSMPLRGTSEIIKNSVVAITFLQLPLAIFSGSMLRTEIFSDAVGPLFRRILRTLSFLLGAALFAAIAWSSLPDAAMAWRINEYEGEGALRVPTWPIRFLVIATSIYAAFAYAAMIWLDWTGQLEQELAYPGILALDAQATAVAVSTGGGQSAGKGN